jgi:DNA polymerase-4
MDAFYASVELLRYPELKGLPVVIGGGDDQHPMTDPEGVRHFAKLRDYAGRGVVTTSTYEARGLGVFSAMGMMKAAKLAPDAVLLPADFNAYRHYSRLFKEAVAGIAPLIEDSGIDEIYIDLTQHPDETLPLSRRIKQSVRDATGLSCSIGVSPNKLLSKICSDLEKPGGITILKVEDIPSRIWPLPVRKVNGIGPKATEKLASIGIHTIEELAHADPATLQETFGLNHARWLQSASHGVDDRPVVTHSEPRSISRETTFERDLHPRHDRPILSTIFTDLCDRLSQDLKERGYLSRTIGIKVRFEDFHTVTRDITITDPTDDAILIRRAGEDCLRRVSLNRRIRLLGVRAGSLSATGQLDAGPDMHQQELHLTPQ